MVDSTASYRSSFYGNDTYLSNISKELLEVPQHFGAEAPALVNAYVKKLKDKLLKALADQNRLAEVIAQQQESINHLQAVLPWPPPIARRRAASSPTQTAWAAM
ncbi:hypothetical protein FB106_11476 [Synechococcus sp. Ace-Pa]|nr:hypothetical protein BM449_00460 [Synechococcus sp. SynAce01]TWB89068.1 hypothetical protein FB106_11476 [Synechococcus sp. Ace-Pa]